MNYLIINIEINMTVINYACPGSLGIRNFLQKFLTLSYDQKHIILPKTLIALMVRQKNDRKKFSKLSLGRYSQNSHDNSTIIISVGIPKLRKAN